MRKAVYVVIVLILLVGVLVVACAPEQPVQQEEPSVSSITEELDPAPLDEALEELEMVDAGEG